VCLARRFRMLYWLNFLRKKFAEIFWQLIRFVFCFEFSPITPRSNRVVAKLPQWNLSLETHKNTHFFQNRPTKHYVCVCVSWECFCSCVFYVCMCGLLDLLADRNYDGSFNCISRYSESGSYTCFHVRFLSFLDVQGPRPQLDTKTHLNKLK